MLKLIYIGLKGKSCFCLIGVLLIICRIIFSCWTRTLNLIQHYLEEAHIEFQRIDGECSLQSRQKTLNEFASNPELRILIMTTGTGAVG